MGSDVAIREEPKPLNVMSVEQLKYIANTEFVNKSLRGNLPAILACVAYGRALGIDDMVALNHINMIDGKPSEGAELMVMLVRRAGHSITGEFGDGFATAIGTRIDNGDTMAFTFTLEMAKRAGLSGKGAWSKYPESLLWARAVSQLCRMLFADCFAGGTYTTEELGAEDVGPDGAPPQDSIDGRAVSYSDPGAESGSVEQAPGMGARTPEPTLADDHLFPPVDADGVIVEPGSVPQAEADTRKITPAMVTKLNVLVGKLRREGHVSTEQLWRSQGLDPELGRGEDGELHWSPLREMLTRPQGRNLLDRLEALENTVGEPSEFAGRAAEAQAAAEARDA